MTEEKVDWLEEALFDILMDYGGFCRTQDMSKQEIDSIHPTINKIKALLMLKKRITVSISGNMTNFTIKTKKSEFPSEEKITLSDPRKFLEDLEKLVVKYKDID